MAEDWEKILQEMQGTSSYLDNPFKKPLKKSGLGHRGEEALRYLGEDKDKIMRAKSLTKKEHEGGFTLEEFKRARILFKKLQSEYGINIPDMKMIAGNEEMRYGRADMMFTWVDTIYGQTFNKMEKLPEEAKDKIDSFFVGLLRHYYDVYLHGGDYWTDFKLENIMYGHKKGETEDKVYLFDIDPYYKTYDSRQGIGASNNLHLITLLTVAGISMNIVKKKFDKHVKLGKSQDMFKDILEKIKMPAETKLHLEKYLPIG